MGKISRVVVIGAGTMGHGIAQVAAGAGWPVLLHDVSDEFIRRGLDGIRANLDNGIARGKVAEGSRDEILARVAPAPDLAEAVATADLVIEAIPEDLELKRDLFRRLDGIARTDAILASNTSSLPVGELAGVTGRADRVIGMHFFNPVHLIPLLEVVRAHDTSDDTVAIALEAGRRMGKEPIVVRDSPGFASSRLGVVLGLEAMRMLEQGIASAEDIDKAMTLGYRHPMGPLKLTDLVGLDVRLAIARYLHRELGTEAFRPPDILERMVAEGRLGKKTGRGFYNWD